MVYEKEKREIHFYERCVWMKEKVHFYTRWFMIMRRKRGKSKREDGHPLSELFVLSRGVGGVTTRQA